jgi:hypothetical protein
MVSSLCKLRVKGCFSSKIGPRARNRRNILEIEKDFPRLWVRFIFHLQLFFHEREIFYGPRVLKDCLGLWVSRDLFAELKLYLLRKIASI